MNKKKLYWVFQLLGWSIYVLLNSVVANFALEQTTENWLRYIPLLSEGIIFFMFTHVYRYFIKRWQWLQFSMTSLVPRVLLCAAVMGVSVYLMRVGISFTIDVFSPALLSTVNIIGNGIANALVIFMWSLFYFIYQYFERYNRSLKSEAAFHQMELNNLKSQLNPHFIFNSLNSIRALVDENPRKSKMAITQLSNILRNSLTTDQKRLTSFDEEIKMVQDYLSLEVIRYEERLNTALDIDPASSGFKVPPLMIQTLVENGIKHGISKLKEGGSITIETVIKNSKLVIQIRNSGTLTQSNGKDLARGTGLGLINTKKRLSLIYGQEAKFSITEEGDNTVLTEIVIPQIEMI